MENANQVVGSVVSLYRYPVKSMLGEELNASEVTERGILGDRVYALVETSSGKVVSAKSPRKWAKLFEFRAALAETPRPGEQIPPVRITLHDGTIVSSEQSDLNDIVSRALGREVTFATTVPEDPAFEYYIPDMEGLKHRGETIDQSMPPGLFFDRSVIHLLTTATLERFRELYPQGRWEVRRFRPNIVVEVASGEIDFVENAWVGQTLAIGDDVRLTVTEPCLRCVMTTLPQADLPKDPGILRATAQHNEAIAGIRANVLRDGKIRRGDPVRLE